MKKMKLAGAIQKAQQKKERKQKREKILQTVINTVIGIPYLKFEKLYLTNQKKRWEKDEEKSKQKVVDEIVRYIKKEMTLPYNEEYWIFNAYRHEDIDYGTCLCLHYFQYETKYCKKLKTFKRIFMDGKNISDTYYNYFFEAIQKHFEAYEDINVTRGVEKTWRKEYEYIKLTIKTKENVA